MDKQEKKSYVAPQLTAVTFRAERGYAASGLFGMFQLGHSYSDLGGDAWSGSASSETNSFGGWTDNGNSAWD